MTAEIAVLNRSGIALASDSAVTISSRRSGKSKVFNSADKLFELSDEHPVAIMVNGSTDCFVVPWEVIIKDFRKKYSGTANKHLKEWAEEILSYAAHHTDLGQSVETDYVRDTVKFEVELIKSEIIERFWNPVTGERLLRQEAVEAMIETSEERSADIRDSFEVATHLINVDHSIIEERYRDIIDPTMNEGFAPVEVTVEARTVLRLHMTEP